MNAGDDPLEEHNENPLCEDVANEEDEEIGELPNLIEKHLAHLLLKLESIYNVPRRCIDELVVTVTVIVHVIL